MYALMLSLWVHRSVFSRRHWTMLSTKGGRGFLRLHGLTFFWTPLPPTTNVFPLCLIQIWHLCQGSACVLTPLVCLSGACYFYHKLYCCYTPYFKTSAETHELCSLPLSSPLWILPIVLTQHFASSLCSLNNSWTPNLFAEVWNM